MSLYNLIFGVNPDADKLFSLLGITPAHCGRFRNIFVDNGCIVVYTRNGGGNREDYQDVFDELSEHPWYSHDADDDFDCTYASIYFTVPESVIQALSALDQGEDPAKQWDSLLSSIRSV